MVTLVQQNVNGTKKAKLESQPNGISKLETRLPFD